MTQQSETKQVLALNVGDVIQYIGRGNKSHTMVVTERTEPRLIGLPLKYEGKVWAHDGVKMKTIPLADGEHVKTLGLITDIMPELPNSYAAVLQHCVGKKVEILSGHYHTAFGSRPHKIANVQPRAYRIQLGRKGALQLQMALRGGSIYRDVTDFEANFKTATGEIVTINRESVVSLFQRNAAVGTRAPSGEQIDLFPAEPAAIPGRTQNMERLDA